MTEDTKAPISWGALGVMAVFTAATSLLVFNIFASLTPVLSVAIFLTTLWFGASLIIGRTAIAPLVMGAIMKPMTQPQYELRAYIDENEMMYGIFKLNDYNPLRDEGGFFLPRFRYDNSYELMNRYDYERETGSAPSVIADLRDSYFYSINHRDKDVMWKLYNHLVAVVVENRRKKQELLDSLRAQEGTLSKLNTDTGEVYK